MSITSNHGSPSPGKFSSAEKRAVHNALERKRRDHIKDMFSQLKDSVPNMAGEKISTKASRAQILKKACDYILLMRKKNTASAKDLEELAHQVLRTRRQIAKLESLRATNRYVETLPPANTAHPTASLNGLPGPSSRSPAARSPRIKQEDESYRTVGPQRVNTQPHELSPHRSQTFAGQSGPGLPAALPGRDNFHLLPHLHTPSGSSSQRLTMPESVGGGGGVVSFPLPQ